MSEGIALRKIADVEDDLLIDFCCERDELREFLIEQARDYAEHGLTHTTVMFVDSLQCAAGYFSLSADGLPLSSFEQSELGLPFDCSISYFPAVKITRLAVHSSLQGKGVGSNLMRFIEGLAYSDSVSVRLLTVDAVNSPSVIGFYQKHGFKTTARQEIRQARGERAAEQQGRNRGRVAAALPPATLLMYKDLYDGGEAQPVGAVTSLNFDSLQSLADSGTLSPAGEPPMTELKGDSQH